MSKLWPENTTVLLVEDDLAVGKLLQLRLQMEGIRVLAAQNGFEALDILKVEQVDLLATDLRMPAMDGYRLTQEVRALPPPKGRTPILIFSTVQNEQDVVRCLSAGADDYMFKPVSIRVMLERLWRLHPRRG